MRLTSRTILTSLDVVLILLLPGLSGINLKEHSGKHFEGRYTRNIDDYEILIPRRINEHGSFVSYSIPSYFKKQPNRTKRSTPESSQKIHYDLSFDGKPHLIEVWPNHDFLSPGLITETWGTGAPSDLSNVKIRSVNDDQCHYLGKVKGDPKSNVALSLCDGMVGHIRTKRHHYFIEPVKDHAPEEDGQHLHIIYTRSVNIRKPTCGIKSDWRTAWQKRFEKEFKERKGAQTDLKADHRERIKKALANSSVSYFDKKRSSESNINYMETLLVADRRFLEYHKGTDYQQYLFTVLNMAAELFHDVSVGSEFELSLVRVIFLEKEENELDLMINTDADATLDDFCKWADSMNFDESHPNHHDIALLITKHDICSEGDCDTTGLAYMSGACSKDLSGAYCEDTGLDLGVIITHEIGHLLGSDHDSDDKNPGPGHCSAMADDYRIHVMAPWSQYSAANWSVCSRKYISEFLENDLGKCFLDEPQEHDFEIPDMPPGVIYDAEWQCTQQFGPSKPCSLSPEKFCKKLACKNPNGKGCVTMGHPPADGTSCGNNKWCYERQCVDIGGRPEAVNGGWSEWSSWSECSRTCGGGATYQERMCDNPLPANHGRYCLGHRRHYKLCNTQPCDEDALTFREVQCEEHDTDELKWIPFDDELAEHVCALVCSNNKNKYRILAPRVKDGTSCKRGGRDKCIAGQCRKVGCDSILDSDAEEDKCGVCNGDGSTCMFYEKMITKTTKEDYQKLFVIPAGCRKITIEEVQPNANFLALGAADGKTFYLNGNYEVDEEGESKVAGTVCVYSEEEPDQETIIIGGPIKEDLVVYMLYNGEDNTGIHCQYSCPLNSLSSKKSSSNSKIQSPFTSYITEVADAAMQILSGGSKNGSTHSNSSCTGKAKHSFHWEFVDWGPCSAFCNGGSQISEPSCIDDSGGKVSKTFCENVPKPQTISRICNDHPCKIRWRTGEWGKCNGSTDNPGSRHRLVECVKESPFMDGVIITDDKNCKKEKPVDQESCKGKELSKELSNKSVSTKEVTKRRNMVISNEVGGSKTKSKIEDNLENEDKENIGSNTDNDSKTKSLAIQVNMKDYEEEDGCPNEGVSQNAVIPSNETLEDYDEKGGCSNNNNTSQTKSTQKIEQLEDYDEEKGCSNKNNVSKTKSMPKIEKVEVEVEVEVEEKGCGNKTEGSKNRSLVIDKTPSNKVKVYEMSLLEDRKKFNMSDAAIDAVGDSIPSIVDECKEKIFSGEKAIKEIQEIRKKNEETANDGSDEEEGNIGEESGCNNTINSASKSIQSNDQSNKQTDIKQPKDSMAENTVNADDIDGKSAYKINMKKQIPANNIDGKGKNKIKMNEKNFINLNKVDKYKNNAYAEDSENMKYSERMYKTDDKLQKQEKEGTAKLQEREKRSKVKTHNAKQKEIKDNLAEIAANGREVEDYNGVSEVAQGKQINSNFNKIKEDSESTSIENQDESEIDNMQAKDSEKLCENECKKVMCDCLHLQLYRDSKDRYKQGQTKASLSLQHFLGVESGFTLDKESNTIAIICQDVTVILAFDTRERLIQWQVKISNNLGEDQQFLIQITSAPPKAKIASGPARLHVMDQRFCMTMGVPPRLMGFWEIGQLRRYGVVEGRFCFEGGSRCGKGEGLHVCVTDQAEEITQTFQLAAQGKLASRRRPVSRKMSAMDSPRKQIHSRPETRHSDLSCTESFQQQMMTSGDMTRSLYCGSEADPCCGCSATESVHDASRHPSAEDLLCPCRVHRGSSSPFWSSAESAAGHHHADLDSNYGCGDTASVTELPEHFHHQDSGWSLVNPEMDRRAVPSSLERCASCISKLGAPSMSRSSTVTNTNTPTGAPFSPAWTMDSMTNVAAPTPMPTCPHHFHIHHPHYHHPRANTSCDRMSLSSHGSGGSSGNSEYSVPRFVNPAPAPPGGVEPCWYDRPRTIAATPPIPPKSPKTPPVPSTNNQPSLPSVPEVCRCQCCPPSRPPKPPQMSSSSSTSSSSTDSPSKKKMKKPPMPLPMPEPPLAPVCTCHHVQHQPRSAETNPMVGPYENYDVPKSLLGNSIPRDPKEESKLQEIQNRMSVSNDEYYDTPKNVKECLSTSLNDPQYGNYDTPPSAVTLRKPCGCIVKYPKKSLGIVPEPATTVKVDSSDDPPRGAECPCQRVMCWAENWMMLPYCRRGNGMENTGVPIHKVKLSGEGKMPVMNPSGEIAIYATVDKSKKTNRRQAAACSCPAGEPHKEDCSHQQQENSTQPDGSNYVNVEAGGKVLSPASEAPGNTQGSEGACTTGLDYENIDFAQSLEYYENSKDFLQRVGLTKENVEGLEGDASAAVEAMEGDEQPLSYTIANGVKFCNKCGHACHMYSPQQPPQQPLPEEGEVEVAAEATTLPQRNDANSNKQDDYLMMEPGKSVPPCPEAVRALGKNFPGYLPMSPITNAACTKADLLKMRMDRASLPSEKSASIPSLSGPIGPAVDRSRKRSDSEFPRVPGSAMMMMHHSANSPYLRRLLHETSDENRRLHIAARRRSSSADSSRYLDELDDLEHSGTIEREISSSHTKLSDTVSSQKLGQSEEQLDVEAQAKADEASDVKSIDSDCTVVLPDIASAEEAGGDETASVSSGSGSLRTLVRECLTDTPQPPISGASVSAAVHIRRSSSVPCKSGNNRDSSSSNDSGVSTGSLKHRGADFAEFELPLTTSMSARRHHHAIQARHHHAGMPLTNCLHASLPRRSKSVDPLREITFQFQKVKIPAKSSSAEAEVPICPGKRDSAKGYASPGADGAIVVPYMDSRSTSSGTSDMSDYIETLSLSSHSSSDTPDSLSRLGRQATTTLRPRSGKEYQLIDRSILEGDMKGPMGSDKAPHQLRGLVSQYANITPVPEKSESPSPGYMSGSPGQEREDQPLISHSHQHPHQYM